MYRILMDGELVWSNETPDVGVYNAKITLEANSTNSMEVSVAHNYPAFQNAKMLQSIVEVYQDDETDPIFVGRPLSKQTDFQGNTIYKFEGVLGYLYDSIQPPIDYTGQTPQYILEHLIAEHNSQTEDYKHFVVGNVSIVDNTDSNTYTGVGRLHDDDTNKDPAYIYQYDSNKTGTNQTDLTTGYESTFDAINNLLINNLHGNLVVRIQNGVMYLDYLEKYLPSEGQVILFGSNLLDFSSTLDYSSICSGVLPLGYSRGSDDYDAGDPNAPDQPDNMFQEEDDPLQTVKSKLTIESVNDGSKILWDQGMIDTYGRIVKAVEWDNCKDANKLLEKAKAYLYKKQYDNLTLECKIIDLHFVEGTYTPIHFMHMIQVKSEPHGLDKMMPVIKMDIDLMNPANDTVSLGQAYNSITGEMANTKDQVSKVSGQANNISSTIKNNNGTTWTNFSKTDKAITMEAHDRQTSVDNAKKELQTDYDAKFQITAQQISSEVSARTESEGKMQEDYTSKINQTANSISTEVTERKNDVNGLSQTVSSHWEQTPTSFSLGFNDNNALVMSYTKGYGQKETTPGVDIKVTGDNILVDADHKLKLNAGEFAINSPEFSVDEGQLILAGVQFGYGVNSETGLGGLVSYGTLMVNHGGDVNDRVLTEQSLRQPGSGLRQTIRSIAQEECSNIKSGYIKKSDVGVNTTIHGFGVQPEYPTYQSLMDRKNELVIMVNDLRAQVRAGCKEGTEPVH